jgi:hypothetical protein
MTSCCEHFADTLPHGCRQGRDCPERTRSAQEREQLRDCARSGQGDLRQIAAHIAAGELDVGYEAADPARREPVRVAREPLPVSFYRASRSELKAIVKRVILSIKRRFAWRNEFL